MTWPTSTVAMLRVLATRTSAAATSLTWVTPPGTPSTSAAPMVCTESTTSSVGPHLLDVAEHRAEVGLGGEVELVVHAAGAVGAQPDLGGRLLAGDVEGAAPGARGLGGDLEQQRATCRRRARRRAGPPRPGTRPPPSTRSSSGTPLVRERESSTETCADRHRRAWSPAPAAVRPVGRGGLGDAAPGLALAAAADPLGRSPSRTRSSGRRARGTGRALAHGARR